MQKHVQLFQVEEPIIMMEDCNCNKRCPKTFEKYLYTKNL